MSSAKTVTGIIVFAKNETTYNQGAAVTGSTDAIQMIDPRPTFAINFNYDGNRGGASFSGGNYKHGAPTGRTAQGTVRIEAKGLGSAYNATTATPPNWHPFLLASGFSGSFQSSNWIYKPLPLGTSPKSLAMALYTRGEVWPVSGAYANMTITAEGPSPAFFDFDLQGMLGTPADQASPPARSWTAESVIPPNAVSCSLSINGWSNAVVRNWNYAHGLEVVQRTDVNAETGTNGFAIGRRDPTFNVTIEQPLLSDYNLWALQLSGSSQALALTLGSASNNKVRLNMPQAYLMNIAKSEDGPVALVDMTFSLAVSAPDTDDDITITALA